MSSVIPKNFQSIYINSVSTTSTSSTLSATVVSSGNVFGSNSTISNAVFTNVSSGTISSIYSTISNVVSTNISSGTFLGTSSTISNVVSTNISSGTFTGTTISTGTLFATSSTISNQVNTKISTGSLTLTGNLNTLGNIITNGPNVGINISPAAPLDVIGGSNYGIVRIANSVIGSECALGFFPNNTFTAQTGSTNGNWYMGTYLGGGSNNFSISRNGGGTPLSITSAGNIGINNVSPSFTLDVSGTGRFTTGITTGTLTASSSTIANQVNTNVSSATLNLTGTLSAAFNSNTLGNLFTTGGNVGINNGSPAFTLDVSGSSACSNLILKFPSAVSTSSVGNVVNMYTPYSFSSPQAANTTYYGGYLNIVAPVIGTSFALWNNSGAPVYYGTHLSLSAGDVFDGGNNGSGLSNLNGGNVYLNGGRAYLGGTFSNQTSVPGSIIFQTGVPGSGSSNNNSSLVERMRINGSTGNVGINTTAPAYTLNVASVSDIPAINPDAFNTVLVYEDQLQSTLRSGITQGNSLTYSQYTGSTTGYVQLTNNTGNQYGQLYWNINPGNSFSCTFDFYVGGGSGADELGFYIFGTSPPSSTASYSNPSNGYVIVYSEYTGNIILYYNGVSLITYTVSSLGNSTWQTTNISFIRNTFRISLNGQMIINYTDTTNRNISANSYMGFNACTGGSNNFHRIRNMRINKLNESLWTFASQTSANIYYSSNVGIGTASPSYTLDVAGTGRFTGNVTLGNTAYIGGNLTVYNQIFSVPGQSLLLDSPGVGNATTIGYNTPKNVSATNTFVVLNNSTDRSVVFNVVSAGTGSGSNSVNSSVAFAANYNSNTLGNLFTTGGNVGISTTGPNSYSVLTLGNGNISTNFTSGAISFAYAGSGFNHFINSRHFNGASNNGNALDFLLNNSTTATGSTAPNFGNVLAMSVTGSGVGIFTSSPAYTLDVSGTTRITGSMTSGTHLITNGSLQATGNSNTLGSLYTTGGNVGINTATPGITLDVAGKLGTYSNTNTAAPTVGNSGGTGDRVILYPGSSTNYPYSLGINGSTMWYSVPSGSQHSTYVNGTVMQSVTATGVGVGTGGPECLLQLYSGTPTFNMSGNGNGGVATFYLGGGGIGSGQSKTAIISQATGVGYCLANLHMCVNTSNSSINTSVADARLSISGNNGYVGIGTTSPAYTLDVGAGSGTFRASCFYTDGTSAYFSSYINSSMTPYGYGSGNIGINSRPWNSIYTLSGSITVSDAREKKNITDVSIGLDFVCKLKPKKYQYTRGGFEDYKLGFIAQDILEIDPGYTGISYDEETDRYALSMESLIAPLVNSIKELQRTVETLQRQILVLEKDNK